MGKTKRKHVSMKKKSSWRKHTDINDVEEFLEEQRLQERIGGNIQKTDEQLYKIEKTPNALRTLTLRQEKKLRAQEPSKLFISLENTSKVEDPIKKRNRVRTLEERKHPLLKAKIKRNKELGIIPQRELQSIKDRVASSKKIINTKEKEVDFKVDLWNDDEEGIKDNPELKSSWVGKNLKQYHLKNLGIDKVKVPQITHEKRSQLKAIDVISGTSYNPSKTDYEELIHKVVEKEEADIKKNEKLNRSLKPLYQKMTKSEAKRRRREEMREGFPTNDDNNKNDDDEKEENLSDTEYKTTNPPVRNKKKDLKKRRKQKEHRLRMAQAEVEKNELKKLKDLGMLKMYKKQIVKSEESIQKRKEDRAVKQEERKSQPRRLARKRFQEEDIPVEDQPESLGNLRKLKPLGSILVDRFKSMQKRNILVPNVKRMPRNRRVVRVKKRSHKEEQPVSTKKPKKSSKLKIHE